MMTKREKPNVLLIYRDMIPSVRLCGHMQMEELARRGDVAYLAKQEMALSNDDMEWADIVLLGRLDSRYELELTRILHNAKKYLIYILDDDLLNVPPNISSSLYYNRDSLRAQIREILALSDAVLSPSPRLLALYAADKKAMLTEEPAVMAVGYAEKTEGEPVRIGFAGSIDRTDDLDSLLRDALIRVKRKYGAGVQFSFFGARPCFLSEIDAEYIPYTASYDLYRERLNSLRWDIGLAPMPRTGFHACKHYNKFIEYAAAGVAGLFSDEEPYTRLKKKGVPGLFTPNVPEGWYSSLCTLVEDGGRRESIRREVCACAHQMFSVEDIAKQLLLSAPDVWAYRAPKKSILAQMPAIRVKGHLWRVRDYAKLYGWELIPKAVGKLRKKAARFKKVKNC